MKNLKDVILERLMIRCKDTPDIPADAIKVKFYQFVGWYVGRPGVGPDDLSKSYLASEGFVSSMSIGDDNGPDAFKNADDMYNYYTKHKNDDVYIDIQQNPAPKNDEYDNIIYIGDDIFSAHSWSNFKTEMEEYLT